MPKPKIAVVGPCGSGKSTVVKILQAEGYHIKAVGQEHSYVADMWARLTKPDILIYLDASLWAIAQRRQISWGQKRLDELNHRLRHARANCHFYINTDALSPAEVAQRIRDFIALQHG